MLKEKEEQRRQAEQQAKMQKLQAVAPQDGSSVILTDADLDKLKVDVLDDAGSMAPPRTAPFPGQPPSLRPQAPPIRQMQPRWVVLDIVDPRKAVEVEDN